MGYTARAVSAAIAPWPLVIGTRTHWARPLSAAFVLRVVPQMTDPTTAPVAVLAALRAAFPRGRWWQRDPLRAIVRLTPNVQAMIVQALFAVPGITTPEEQDPEAALIAAHRKLAGGDKAQHAPTLAIAALTCEARMGAAWYYDPRRWPTADGYAPLATVWTTYTGLAALDARQRLEMAQAVSLANAHGPTVSREWEKITAAAFPPDPSMRGRN